jgi:hypothetical protein
LAALNAEVLHHLDQSEKDTNREDELDADSKETLVAIEAVVYRFEDQHVTVGAKKTSIGLENVVSDHISQFHVVRVDHHLESDSENIEGYDLVFLKDIVHPHSFTIVEVSRVILDESGIVVSCVLVS